ncbi:MAG: hypothetical protein EU529_03250 [Promethearchaeota archaeon]|nr:MAG: hypothetical protein EU529_03250 [Candidatus Lokiarchaeota archaeon]
MSHVKIRCPSCSANGEIEISEDYLKNVSKGLLAINIPEGTICEHTFIAYVDRNLKVRDYFIADFKIDLPDIAPSEEIEEKKIPSKEVINLDLIKLNLSALLLTYVLKSIFSKQKIVLVSDQEFLYEHIHNFFNYITRDAFKAEIEIVNNQDYKKNKKEYQDCMVFEGNKILNNIEKIIDDKKLKVEKYFIQSFLSEHDLSYSYIMLKNEIRKSHQLSKSIVDYANEQQIEKLDVKIIVDFLIEKFNLKLQKTYLNFIINILKYYFEVNVSETSDASGFLKLI